MTAELWPRTLWAESVWRSETLKSHDKLIALAFADHARDQSTAWVTYDRLAKRTGLGRTTIALSIKRLRDQGFLVVVDKGGQHVAPRYRLVAQRSAVRTSDDSSSSHREPLDDAQMTAPRTPDPARSSAGDSSAVRQPTSTPALIPEQRGGDWPSLGTETPAKPLRCSEHAHIPHDDWVPKCRACQVRREQAEQDERAQIAAARASRIEEAKLREQCPDCDELGRPEEHMTGRLLSRDRCTHPKIRRSHDGSTDDRLGRLATTR
jgi:biotin operon repressor